MKKLSILCIVLLITSLNPMPFSAMEQVKLKKNPVPLEEEMDEQKDAEMNSESNPETSAEEVDEKGQNESVDSGRLETEKQEAPLKNQETNTTKENIIKEQKPDEKTEEPEKPSEMQALQEQELTRDALAKVAEKRTSKLGHIRSSNVKIYKDASLRSSFKAGATYTHAVYYIKKEAVINGGTYYLISRQPSSVRGTVGWIKAGDMSTHRHLVADKNNKTFIVNGSGSAYNKAWGGRKNYVYSNLSKYKGQIFKVHLTETVGKNVWYRGVLNGKTVWIHSKYVSQMQESKTSYLGHIRSAKVKIYKEDFSSSFSAGSTYTHRVYYIKKQALINREKYYLISQSPSSSRGVVGWVKAKDLSVQRHLVADKNNKTFIVNGSGSAYNKAWGGRKNYVYSSLSKYKGQIFKVHLTETVGKNVWYRGVLNGKTVWIHNKYVSPVQESKTSHLGHIRSSKVKIYKEDFSSSFSAGSTYTHHVYYIKKQSIIHNEKYYLISKQPSSEKGVVGWISAKDLSTHKHVGIDKKAKTFYVKGSGSAYSKAWGGKKDYVYSSLKGYANQQFKVNLTEKVGNNTWYRGVLNGKTAWLHSSQVQGSNVFTNYTKYNMTLQQAVNAQMARSPQTDKYRNNRAYVHKDYITLTRTAAINSNSVRLRTSAKFADNIAYTVNSGTQVTVLGQVNGASYNGSKAWYKISYKKKTLYVHKSLVNPKAIIAKTTANVNLRESANNKSHVYATLPKGTSVNVVKEGNPWHEVSYGVWRNAKSADVRKVMDPDLNSKYQHLVLTSSAGVSAAELNKLLAGKGELDGLGQAFIDSSKKYSVNEVYLISHALLETGNGTSLLSKGIKVGTDKKGQAVLVNSKNQPGLKNIKTVYNMFGIRAYDSCPNTCGAKHAYEQGWDSPKKAIIGGAKFIGGDYIHNGYKQNTLYKMRWNLVYPPKQYATDIGWAIKQTARIQSLYEQLHNPVRTFDVPKFK